MDMVAGYFRFNLRQIQGSIDLTGYQLIVIPTATSGPGQIMEDPIWLTFKFQGMTLMARLSPGLFISWLAKVDRFLLQTIGGGGLAAVVANFVKPVFELFNL